MSKVILLVAENHLSSDGRAIRFAGALSEAGYKVVGAGFERGSRSPPTSIHQFCNLITVANPLDSIWRRYLARGGLSVGALFWPFVHHSDWMMPQQWAFQKAIVHGLEEAGQKPDIVIAKYWTAIPVAVSIARKYNAKLVYDACELSFAEREQSRRWRWMVRPTTRRIEIQGFRMASLSTTIGKALADAFVEEYSLENAPVVLRNIPDCEAIQPTKRVGNLKLIYSGNSDPSRELHRLIESVELWRGGRQLTLQLTGRRDHIDALRSLVGALGLQNKVKFIEAAAQSEIVSTISNYDIGLCFLPLFSRQMTLAEPNKLHQYLSAGLPVLTSRGEAFLELFEKYKCGECFSTETVSQIADAVNSIDETRLVSLRKGVENYQRQNSWDDEKAKLTKAIGLISIDK